MVSDFYLGNLAHWRHPETGVFLNTGELVLVQILFPKGTLIHSLAGALFHEPRDGKESNSVFSQWEKHQGAVCASDVHWLLRPSSYRTGTDKGRECVGYMKWQKQRLNTSRLHHLASQPFHSLSLDALTGKLYCGHQKNPMSTLSN